MSKCDWCYSNPASIFTPQVKLCRGCKAELDRQELEDNEVPNAPTCGVDGAVLNSSGVCPECVTRSVRDGHRDMRRVG